MTLPLIPTQLVGSYTKPRWLYRKEALLARDWDSIWVPEEAVRAEAQDDAVRLAVGDQERAGLDVVTDGEQRRTSFVNYFYRFGGIDPGPWGVRQWSNPDNTFIQVTPEAAIARGQQLAPRVTGPITWPGPMALDDLRFLKRVTRLPVKMTVVGPVTAAGRLLNEYYPDERSFALAVADALNQELRALDAEGVDVLQIDEPDVHMRRRDNQSFAAEAIDRAIAGVRAKTVVHLCYGYSVAMKNKRVDEHFGSVLATVAGSGIDAINLEYEEPGHSAEILSYCGDKEVVLGVLNLGTERVETPEHIAGRVREALEYVPAERLSLAPDCGMWFLPRPVAFAKIRAMALGAAIVRAELTAPTSS